MRFDVMIDVKMQGTVPVEADNFEEAISIAKGLLAGPEGYSTIRQMVSTKRCELNDFECELAGLYRS